MDGRDADTAEQLQQQEVWTDDMVWVMRSLSLLIYCNVGLMDSYTYLVRIFIFYHL